MGATGPDKSGQRFLSGSVAPRVGDLSAGSLRRQLGNQVRILQQYQREHEVLTNWWDNVSKLRMRCEFNVDLQEAFAGAARASHRAHLFGLSASEPCEKATGWDLATAKGRALWKHTITVLKPYLIMMGYPCTLWNFYNSVVNYADYPELLAALRDEERPVLRLVVWSCIQQDDGGRAYLLENTATSRLHGDPDLDPLRARPSSVSGVSHGCRLGFKGPSGRPLKKLMRWWSNKIELILAICNDDLKCNHVKGQHEPSRARSQGCHRNTPVSSWTGS